MTIFACIATEGFSLRNSSLKNRFAWHRKTGSLPDSCWSAAKIPGAVHISPVMMPGP